MSRHALHGDAQYSFAKEEYDRRFSRAREKMRACGIDILLITQLENLHYFSGLAYYDIEWSRYMYLWPNILIIPQDGEPEAIAHHIYQESALNCYPFGNVEVWAEGSPEDEPEYVRILHDRLEELGMVGAKIGCEMDDYSRMELGVKQFGRIIGRARGSEFVDASPLISDLRMIKSSAEVAALRTVCGIQDQAIARMRERLHAGMLGDAARRIFREEVSKLGGRPLWELGSHFGGMLRPRGPEGGRDKRLEKGDVFNFDFGTSVGAYQADFGRTWVVGTPTADQLRDHERASLGVRATIDACRPEATASDVVRAFHAEMDRVGAVPETVISSSGFVGHGIGLSMVERPLITLRSQEKLRAGMVLAVEPSIESKHGWFNYEQMILVTEDGYELLSTAPTDFYQIPDHPA